MISWKENPKTKVLTIIDYHDWAFSRIADQIVKRYSDVCQFNVLTLGEPVSACDADILLMFWWASTIVYAPVVKAKKTIVAFYDHLTWKDNAATVRQVLDLADVLIFANETMRDEFQEQYNLDGLSHWVCEDGVDTNIFKPANAHISDFSICWAGSSQCFSGSVKGISFLRAACEKINVPLFVADRKFSNGLPFSEMPAFYNNASAGVYPALKEGTPNPLLETLSCGRPVAITSVGLAPKIIQEGENGVFIHDRTVDGVVDAIERLRRLHNKNDIIQKTRNSVLSYDWSIKIEQWKEIFDGG